MASNVRNDNGSSSLFSSSGSPTFRSMSDSASVDTPLFHTPQSSPEPFVLQNKDPTPVEELVENEPLMVGHTKHFGTFHELERSMSLSFPGSDSSTLSCWETTREAFKMSKPIILSVFALAFSVLFAWHPEESETARLVCISRSIPQTLHIPLDSNVTHGFISIEVSGPFPDEDDSTPTDKNITIGLSGTNGTVMEEAQSIPVSQNSSSDEEQILPMKRNLRLKINKTQSVPHITLALTSDTSYPVAVSLMYFIEPLAFQSQVILAFIILTGVYILIIFELVHRAVAAMLGALAALSLLSFVNRRPQLETVLSWVEWETLALLFGMMILIAVFAKTGFFDFIALKAYKISRGHVWRLITLLCTCTAIISALLDNVTVILLLTPVTVRLCQVLNLNPTYVLIAEVIFSNIGGTATAIGDPPNVIIVSNKDIRQQIDFADFTLHLSIGICFCVLTGYITLRLLYWKIKIVNDDPPIIEELKREAEIWRRTAARVPQVSAEEKTVKILLLQKTMMIENTIRNLKRTTSRREAFQQNLQELETKYVIKDRMLLMKSTAVIVLVVTLFFIQSILNLRVGWIAALGAIILILLADINNIEDLMEQVEWTTLVFFAGLFILMKSLSELGLMEFLSDATSNAIQSVDHDSQLLVAMVTIIWFSAFVSSFVDNIPFTTAMIPVVLELHKQAGIPLQPLVWALAMGSCLGGNGTLIGASANVVCAGLAEQYGYPISFNKFFKVGFPVMIVTTATATGYLLIICKVFSWGNT